jgi:hypothetical protein
VLALAPDGVDYVLSAFSAGNIGAFAQLVRPFGHITAIDDPGRPGSAAAEGEEHLLALGANVHPPALHAERPSTA